MGRMLVFLALGGLLLHGRPARAADTVSGSATVNGQTAVFEFGLAQWKVSDRTLSLAFFPSPLDAAAQAAGLAKLFRFPTGVPYVVLALNMKQGTKTAAPSAVNVCQLTYLGYKELVNYVTDGAKCGIAALSGELRAGALVQGSVKGGANVAAAGPSPAKEFAWELTFELTLK